MINVKASGEGINYDRTIEARSLLLCTSLMADIAGAVPILPVSLVSTALLAG